MIRRPAKQIETGQAYEYYVWLWSSPPNDPDNTWPVLFFPDIVKLLNISYMSQKAQPGTRDADAKIRDVPGNMGQLATLVLVPSLSESFPIKSSS